MRCASTPEAVRVFLAGRADELAEAFTEIAFGKNADRLQLARALDACRLTGDVLFVAKLDRLQHAAIGISVFRACLPSPLSLSWHFVSVTACQTV